jgi:hypothetical protein
MSLHFSSTPDVIVAPPLHEVQLMTASLHLSLGKSESMPGESGKEESWSHGQECTHSHNAHYCSDGEVCAGQEMKADAISDQEIEDDHIEQTCEQAR